jgi:hypothetical protein
MKKLTFFFPFVAALLLLRTGADAGAFSLAGVQTVATDFALDVIRNPALLATQKENNSLGLLFLATPYNAHYYDNDSYLTSIIASVRASDQMYRTGSICFSYSRKIPGGAVGFAIDTQKSYQAEYYRYKKTYLSTDTINTNYAVLKCKYDTISPCFVVSYGSVISGNHSIGMQIKIEYSLTHDDSSYTSAFATGLDQRHHSIKKIEGISPEVSAGYVYRDDVSQAGIMLRSGRFNWQKSNIYYTHAGFPSSQFFSGSISDPLRMRYDKSFSIVAGGYRKMAQYIAVALEGEYQVPASFGEKNLRYDVFTGFYGIKVNSAVNNKGLYCLRGGFEILPSGPATISLGASISTTSQKKSARFLQETKTTDEYAGSLGIDFKLTNTILVMAGAQISYTNERIHTASSYFTARSEDESGRFYNLKSYLGMSFSF